MAKGMGTTDMTQRFEGKLAVVTGAARGIGAAIARRLLAEGAEVVAVDKSAFSVDAAYGADADRATAVAIDLGEASAPSAILEEAGRSGATVDFLINNAGVGGAKTLAETTDAEWDRFILLDLTQVFRMSRDFLPAMRKPGGRIVNISSVFGLVGFPGSLAYSVAKAGVAQLTRQTAVDLAPAGVLVNAIAPGVIETEMTRARIDGDAWYQAIQVKPTPVGRVGAPEDVAGAAAFLCSDDASFIAGHVLTVDGGWLATRHLARDAD